MRAEVVLSLWAVIALSDIQAQPCPEAGRDTTVQVYPSPFGASQLQGLLGGDDGGVWVPEFVSAGLFYDPCKDGQGEFVYIQNVSGCPADSATLTIEWLWDPCAWQVEEVCYTDSNICITIPPFPGEHPDVQYEFYILHIWDLCSDIFGFFSLDEWVTIETERFFEEGCQPFCFYIKANFLDLPVPSFSSGLFTHYTLGWERMAFDGIWCDPGAGYLSDINLCSSPCSPSGIEDSRTSIEEIKLFPNPVRDEICLTWPFEDTPMSIYRVDILDVNGHVLIALNSAEENVRVDHLPSGVYFLRLHGENNGQIMKFIKM